MTCGFDLSALANRAKAQLMKTNVDELFGGATAAAKASPRSASTIVTTPCSELHVQNSYLAVARPRSAGMNISKRR
jgi:hypothetical protein